MQKFCIHTISIGEAGLPLDLEIMVGDVQPPETEGLPLERVTLVGSVIAVDTEFLLRGRLEGTFVGPCDRCLCEASIAFSIEVCWLFEEGPPASPLTDSEGGGSDSRDKKTFQGNEIDLGPVVWEETVFSAPGKLLCREDCVGLCAHCGANLNSETCRCRPDSELGDESAGKGFAGLACLFPDLKEEPSEE